MDSVLDVLSNAIEDQGSIRGRHAFFQDCSVSEANKGIPPRLFWSHARGKVVLDPHCEVRFQFSFDLVPYLGTREEI